MEPELTVVIPCHGGAHRLPETLSALAGARSPAGGLEIVVVDDGSLEPVPDAIGEALPVDVRVLRLDPNRGRASACNAGLEAARGRVVLILDDDMTVASETPAGHLAAHPRGETARAVIGRIDPDPAFFTGRFGRFLAEEEAARRERLRAHPDDVSFESCLTGHFSVPLAVLREAGGYDGSFSRYGFEDIELGFRLSRRGLPLTFRDDLRTRHRSEHAGFRVHCRRHVEAGAMASVFARASDAPEVRAYLRADAAHAGRGATRFQRLMGLAHRAGAVRPRVLRTTLLAAARGGVHLLEWVAPRRILHGAYHLVRAMHYAAGLADARTAR